VVELPAVERGLDLGEPLGPDDDDHPLLALGDHDLQGSIPSSRSGTRSRWTSTPTSAGHLGERRGEPGGAAVLQRLDEPGLDSSSEASISFLPVNGSPTCTEGRFSAEPSPSSWLASTEAPPIPSRPGGRAVEDEQVPRSRGAGARDAFRGQQADAHRVDEAVAGVGLVEDRLSADVGTPTQLP
jgi:hypothetical protein